MYWQLKPDVNVGYETNYSRNNGKSILFDVCKHSNDDVTEIVNYNEIIKNLTSK